MGIGAVSANKRHTDAHMCLSALTALPRREKERQREGESESLANASKTNFN